MRIYRIASRLSFIRKVANYDDVYLDSVGKETEPEDIVVVKIPFAIHSDFLPKRKGPYGGAEVGFEWLSNSLSFDEFGYVESYDDDMKIAITHIDGYELSKSDIKKLGEAGLLDIVKSEVLSEYLEDNKKPAWMVPAWL